MRAPRTRFAAPFVAIAASCGHASSRDEGAPPPPPPITFDTAVAAVPPADALAPVHITRMWNFSRDPHGACSYFEDQCSKLARAPGEPIPPCNPPPSKPIACPPYVDPTMGAEVVQHDDGTCALASTGARVDCPP